MNWIEYKNERYHYTLRYPSSGQVDQSDPAHVIIQFVQPFGNGQGEDVLTFNVKINDKPAGLTAEKWALKQWDSDSIKEQGPDQLGGRPAFHIKAWEEDEDTEHVYLAEARTIYELHYVDPGSLAELAKEDQARLSDILQKILQSFTLLPVGR